MKKTLFCFMFVLALSMSLWGQYSIAAASTNYTQDFNTLTNGTWSNGTTLSGWYAKTDATASIVSYGANTGSTTTAGLYAFGVAGTNPLTDRALGYAPSNSYFGAAGTGKGYVGWRLKNNTGSTITSLTVTWTGEQWRRENNTSAHNVKLFYQTGTTVTDLTAGTWTDASSMFTGPITGTSATALDGNATANRVANITVTISGLTLTNGNEIMLRWEDLNDSGNDHFLAIDDVTINATAQSYATEPSAQPTVLTFNNVGSASFDVSFTAASGSPAGYLAVRRAGAAPTTDPSDGSAYTVGTSLGNGTVAFSGSGTFFSESSLSPSTTYYYKIYSFNGSGATTNYLITSPLTGSQATTSGVVLPSVTTTAITSITTNSASGGGNVTADGNGTITDRGICWSTSLNPTTANSTYSNGSGSTGAFTSPLTGLSANQLYHVRAYAVNSEGTSYGNDVTFTTLKDEPVAHVTSFAAGTATSTSIPLTWTDSSADGYLIKGIVGTGSITAPTDGVAEADAALVHNVTAGVQTYTFSSLSGATTYKFAIYPYNNSGTGINYKTDGVVPTVTKATTTAPTVTALIIPQYMQGLNGTNTNRTDLAFRLKLDNLNANATYRYYNLFALSSDGATADGAGILMFPNGAGNFSTASTGNMGTAGSYGTFTTDGAGSYTGWFLGEASGNVRFTPGNNLYVRVMLNDGNNGTVVATRLTTTETIQVINYGASSSNGTAVYGNMNTAPKTIVAMYDNTAGTGRPITCTYVESDGLTLGTSVASFYRSKVDGKNGYFGTIIPNTLANGIQRMEFYYLAPDSFFDVFLESTGVWGSQNTVNPSGGTTTPLILSTAAISNIASGSNSTTVTEPIIVPNNAITSYTIATASNVGSATAVTLASQTGTPAGLLNPGSVKMYLNLSMAYAGNVDVTIHLMAPDSFFDIFLETFGKGWERATNVSHTANSVTFTVPMTAKGDIDIIICDGDPNLPVELSSFSAVVTSQYFVQLNWTTQSETNVSGYYIYRNTNSDLASAIKIPSFITATNTSSEANYSYVDEEVETSGMYYYWLQNMDMDGQTNFHGPISVVLNNSNPVTPPVIPVVTELRSIYPNPFNPTAIISYNVAKATNVSISVFNVKGEKVRSLVNDNKNAGTFQVSWNGVDESGRACTSGIYYVKMIAGKFITTQKVVLAK